MAKEKNSHTAKLAAAKARSDLLAEQDKLVTTELIIEEGPERPYAASVLSDDILDRRLTMCNKEKAAVAALVILALSLRTAGLEWPDSVVFDEVHFGKFAAKYIKGIFFFDVHPPLAKMLFAGIGLLGGFNGNFQFEKIGDEYPADVPYVLMRQLSAFSGVATVILLYVTLKASGVRPVVALVTALLLILETANATIDRFILLDSPMLFFIAAAAFSYVKLEVCKPFTGKWYKSLIATGLCLGMAVSSKWVGLFTIAWVGICNVLSLTLKTGDLNLTTKSLLRQFFLRGVALLGTAFVVYLGAFYVHFSLLQNEGDAPAFMSSRFRSTLKGNNLPTNVLADVGVSSIITLKHYQEPEAYLHSHDEMYPSGSTQQQITLYPYRDENNKWSVELYNVSSEPLEFQPITDGTKIRLMHFTTQRRLHSHDVRPSVSEVDWQNEASGYGFEGFEGDPNDDFIVEIVKDLTPPGVAQERVRAMNTVFRLHHAMTGCYLFSHETRLPKWGFEQNEVTCAKQGIESLEYWYVEENENIYLDQETADRVSYEPLSFWGKFVEINKKMWAMNNKLTQHHPYESQPTSWPAMVRGISYWKQDNRQVYFLGNPIVWWISSFIAIPFAITLVVQLIRWQYGCKIDVTADSANYTVWMTFYLLGWFLHYFPSFLMGRQMFVHHYLPALYFGILALGQTLEFFYVYFFRGKFYTAYVVYGVLLSIALFSYVRRDNLVYGKAWTQAKCESSKLFSSWDYDCNIYKEPPPDAVKSISEEPSAPSINFADAIKVDNA